MKEVPDILNRVVDTVLAYRPKPKTKAAKKRKRLKTKQEKGKKPTRAAGFLFRNRAAHTVALGIIALSVPRTVSVTLAGRHHSSSLSRQTSRTRSRIYQSSDVCLFD
jgi:hypothetical protein